MRTFIVAMIAAAMCACGFHAYAQNAVKYPDGFPERGKEVLDMYYSDAVITSVYKGGRAKVGTVYNVWGTIGGKKLELTLDGMGEVYEDLRVLEIPLTDVPVECMEAAKEKMEGREPVTAERIEHGDGIEYRIMAAEERVDDDIVQQFVVLVGSDTTVLKYYHRDKIE